MSINKDFYEAFDKGHFIEAEEILQKASSTSDTNDFEELSMLIAYNKISEALKLVESLETQTRSQPAEFKFKLIVMKALVLMEERNWVDSKKTLEHAYEFYLQNEEIPESRWLGQLYYNLSRLTYSNYDKENALVWIRKGYHVFEKLGNYSYLGKVTLFEGLLSRDEPEILMRKIEEAIEIFKSISNNLELGNSYHNKGMALNSLGKKDEAIVAYKSAISYHRSSNNFSSLQSTYKNLGRIYLSSSDFKNARNVFQEGTKISRQISNIANESFFNASIAYIMFEIGQIDDAFQIHNNNVTYLKSLELKGEIGNSILALAMTYKRYGNLDLAVKGFEDARSAFEELNDNIGIIKICFELGGTYLKLGNYSKSLSNFEKYSSLTQNAGMTQKLIAKYHIGKVYYFKGQFDKSLQLFKQALDYAKTLQHQEYQGMLLNSIGKLYHLIGKTNKAEKYLRECEKLFRDVKLPIWEAETLSHLALIQQDYVNNDLAVELHLQSLNTFKKVENRVEIIDSLFQFILILMKVNDLENASLHFEVMKDYVKKLDNYSAKTKVTLIESLLLNRNDDLESKIQSRMKLDGLFRENNLNRTTRIITIFALVENYLIDIRVSDNIEVTKVKIEEIIDELLKIAGNQNNFRLKYETKLLQARYFIALKDYRSANEILDEVNDELSTTSLQYLQEKIKDHKNILISDLQEFRKIITENANILDAALNSLVTDYIEYIFNNTKLDPESVE